MAIVAASGWRLSTAHLSVHAHRRHVTLLPWPVPIPSAPRPARSEAQPLTLDDNPTHGPLGDLIEIALRYKSVIIVSAIIVPIVALLVSTQQGKVYQATSEVLLDRQDLGAALTGIPSASSDADPERYARTQAAIASVPSVAERAIRISRVSGVTPRSLLNNSTIEPRVDSDLLRFTVDSPNASDAAKLATAFASAFTSNKLESETASLRRARKELEGRLTSLRKAGAVGSQMYSDVFKKVQDIRTLELLQSRASVVRPAVTAEQVRPRPVRSVALGAVLGIILGFGFAVLRNTFDRSVRSVDEIEDGLGLALLARLSKYAKGRQGREALVMLGDPSHPAAESVRLLRTNVELAAMDGDIKTLLVTSAAPREGKSTTLANLAVALARSGHKVALVDLDLRGPTQARNFDIEARAGITDVVRDKTTLQEALVPIRLPPPAASRAPFGAELGSGALFVVTSGTVAHDPGEFVGSHGLAEVVGELRKRFDFVLIDAPPILAVGDAVLLSVLADALFVVVRLDTIDRPALRDLSRALKSCQCPKLGFVQTNVEPKELYGTAQYGQGPRELERQPSGSREVAAPHR